MWDRIPRSGRRACVPQPALERTRTPLCSAVFSCGHCIRSPLVLTRCPEDTAQSPVFPPPTVACPAHTQDLFLSLGVRALFAAALATLRLLRAPLLAATSFEVCDATWCLDGKLQVWGRGVGSGRYDWMCAVG